eukprot:152068-Chlamydomonas_euryale.AAC.1
MHVSGAGALRGLFPTSDRERAKLEPSMLRGAARRVAFSHATHKMRDRARAGQGDSSEKCVTRRGSEWAGERKTVTRCVVWGR